MTDVEFDDVLRQSLWTLRAVGGTHFSSAHGPGDGAYRGAALERLLPLLQSQPQVLRMREAFRALPRRDVLYRRATFSEGSLPSMHEPWWPLVGTLECHVRDLDHFAEGSRAGHLEHLWLHAGDSHGELAVSAKALKQVAKAGTFTNLRGLRVAEGKSIGAGLATLVKKNGGSLESIAVYESEGSASVNGKTVETLGEHCGALRTLRIGAAGSRADELSSVFASLAELLGARPIETLALDYEGTSENHLAQLMAKPHAWLKALRLPYLRADEAVFDLLEELPGLSDLQLSGFQGGLGNDQCAALLSRPIAQRLERLQLTWPAELPFANTALRSLRALAYSGQDIAALNAETPFANTLEELLLTNVAPGDIEFAQLGARYPKLWRIFANGGGEMPGWTQVPRTVLETGPSVWIRQTA